MAWPHGGTHRILWHPHGNLTPHNLTGLSPNRDYYGSKRIKRDPLQVTDTSIDIRHQGCTCTRTMRPMTMRTSEHQNPLRISASSQQYLFEQFGHCYTLLSPPSRTGLRDNEIKILIYSARIPTWCYAIPPVSPLRAWKPPNWPRSPTWGIVPLCSLLGACAKWNQSLHIILLLILSPRRFTIEVHRKIF